MVETGSIVKLTKVIVPVGRIVTITKLIVTVRTVECNDYDSNSDKSHDRLYRLPT